jgi:SET domain-containing protein
MVTSQKLYIRKNSKIHASGLFAKADISAGTRIIEYRGLKITKAQSDKIADVHIEANKRAKTVGSVYIFTLNQKYDINGKVTWNLAKYINHSCDPNCETDIIKGKIWISAIKDIKKGEELSYDYGYDMFCFEDHPCRCGSQNCIGYIVRSNLRWRVKKRLIENKKSRFNKNFT